MIKNKQPNITPQVKQIRPKVSRRKKITKIRVEISKIEIRKKFKKSN